MIQNHLLEAITKTITEQGVPKSVTIDYVSHNFAFYPKECVSQLVEESICKKFQKFVFLNGVEINGKRYCNENLLMHTGEYVYIIVENDKVFAYKHSGVLIGELIRHQE